MVRDYVLLATLGQTDVQVVLPGPDGKRRYSIAKESQRRFHQDCLDDRIRWRMQPLTEPLLQEEEHRYARYDPEARSLTVQPSVPQDCTGIVELCSPLLAKARAQFSGRIREVVLFTTHRENGPREEPIAAAHLVQAVLAETFGLEPKLVREVVYLRKGEVYECDRRGQRHLRGDAARCIDAAIADLRRRYPDAGAVVEEVGGIPEAKAVVAASCNYRFQEVIFLRPTERERDAVPGRTVRLPPTDSLTTRATVSRLVESGNFAAAAGLVEEQLGREAWESEPWRCWLQHVMEFFEGTLTKEGLATKQDPPSRTCSCLQELLPLGPVVAAGFRVESALRRENWAWALRETFTFHDLAWVTLFDHHLSQPGTHCMNVVQGWFFPQESKVAEGKTSVCTHVHKDGKMRIDLHDPKNNTLADVLTDELPSAVRTHWREFRKGTGEVRHLRNAATHRCLEASVLRACVDTCHKSGLWCAEGNNRFLGMKRTEDLFLDLGIDNPAALYARLVEAILHDMDAFSFRS